VAQTLEDQMFAHWRVPADALGPLLPAALELDTFAGRAYLTVSVFRVRGLRLRGLLPVPVVSSFLQLNVRTYVTAGDKRGVWFFSLDVSSLPMAELARRASRLPFHFARMAARSRLGWLEFSCVRQAADRPYVFDARYRPTRGARTPHPGSLEHFLTERYCFYTADERGVIGRTEIHHPPWSLERTEAEFELNTVAPAGVDLPDEEPLLHFSKRMDVLAWAAAPTA
jgi:uncharacterized protein YqjF (DUF2071 family)